MKQLEIMMAQHIKLAKLPKPEREYRAIPGRRYRFDFAWPEHRLLLEVNGGTYAPIRCGHSSGVGLDRDYLKSSLAAAHGWLTMSFSGKQVRSGLALEVLQLFFERHHEAKTSQP